MDLSNVALLVAAGSGTRFGGSLPKQYADLHGQPILRWTAQLFLGHPRIDRVVIVIDTTHASLYDAAVGDLDLLPPVPGATTRQASVAAGLEALVKLTPAKVLVHDAVRPLTSPGLIDRVLDALDSHQAVVPAIPVTDTIRRFAGDIATADIDRRGLFRMQTPQGFDFPLVLAAHRAAAGQSLTDDAAVAAAAGMPVHRVAGDEGNVKITITEDLGAITSANADKGAYPATGTGFDVHRLVPDRPLHLCGLEIPFELGLDGHSDADVALHALTDAILGTIGAGDIGSHFPPSDARWRNADSAIFLRHALRLVREAGGALVHVDLTIIGERPRIGPHRAAMVARLAELLELEPRRIGLKATTTEGLGFTGRGEGLAAQAVATVMMVAG